MSIFDYDDDIEDVVMNQGDIENITIDGQWTESELSGDVDDECMKMLFTKYIGRAMYDNDLIKPQYLAETIKDRYDLIEEYNKQYNKRKGENKFGIHYFDEWLATIINKLLTENLVGGK